MPLIPPKQRPVLVQPSVNFSIPLHPSRLETCDHLNDMSGVFRSILSALGAPPIPAKIPSIRDERPVMISVKSMRYVYASVVVGSLIGGYAMMSLVEKLNQNRTDSDPSFRRRQLTPAERELAEQQRAAILQMRKRAKEATWQENLSAASAATAEFMVPPSVRAEQQREKDWEERSREK